MVRKDTHSIRSVIVTTQPCIGFQIEQEVTAATSTNHCNGHEDDVTTQEVLIQSRAHGLRLKIETNHNANTFSPSD